MEQMEVKALRLKLGWSQQHFAEVLGVGIATVANWELGHYKPSPLAMEKLEKLKAEKSEC